MAGAPKKPVILGDKLRTQTGTRKPKLAQMVLVSLVLGQSTWWWLESIEISVGVAVLSVIYFVMESFKGSPLRTHFLISADKQGFMKTLKLSDKTAIFDGHNIYHFGREHGIGTRALAALIKQIRSDGYRVVCFFDANIFHTLLENSEFQKGPEGHSIEVLQRLFGLKEDEIYIVPSRKQADLYIIETLSQLPVSFAITNDKFRDYEAQYDFLTVNKEWRKGVRIKDGKLMLDKYYFKSAS